MQAVDSTTTSVTMENSTASSTAFLLTTSDQATILLVTANEDRVKRDTYIAVTTVLLLTVFIVTIGGVILTKRYSWCQKMKREAESCCHLCK